MGTSYHWRGRLPGRAGGYPPGPPTDPDVRNSRIRFLMQSCCCPLQSTGVLLSGLVSSRSLPCLLPADALPGGRLPSRGSLGPHFPTCTGTMRRYDCRPAPLGALRLSLASPIPCLLPSFVVSVTGSWPGGSPCATPGLLVTRSPLPGLGQGDQGLSQVPELPLGIHAPLLDPGGVLSARPCALRTAAFRALETVGFPLATAQGYPCVHD